MMKLGSALIAAVVALLQWVAPSVSAREFRAADTQAYDYPTVQALMRMDRIIQERTGGRHSIKVFHSRQLGEEKETIEQTRVGAIDINRSSVAPFASFVPDAGILAMPFLFRSTEHLHHVLDGDVGAEILARFEPYGFVGLAFYDSGARSIYNSARPVKSMDDLKGLRIRVQQSDQMIALMTALGAEPVPLPYGQVTTALSTGIVDGAENNWPSFVTTGHFKYAKYLTLTEHAMIPEVLVMSKRAWESLNPADQQIFREAARDSSLYMRAEWEDWEGRARREAEAAGIVISGPIDKAPFVAATRGLYEEYVKDPRLKDLIERIGRVE